MKGIVDITVRLIRAGKRAYAQKGHFFVAFAVVLLGSLTLLAALDLLPEAASVVSEPVTTGTPSYESPVIPVVSEFPVKIDIQKIKLSVSISNPTTTDIIALDKELLKGSVRYPTSAKLGETGNVVLFGHSSYLPIVGNQAYKAFNGIQKLVAGDAITVYSSTTAYTYRVRTVEKESADNAVIPLSVTSSVLTLSTCDSFGKASDRFVVVADFVGSHSISIR